MDVAEGGWDVCGLYDGWDLWILPAAAEGFVERDQVGGDQAIALHELILGRCEGALGVDHVEEVAGAALIERVGQVYGAAVSVDGLLQELAAALLFGVGRQRVLHVFERGED